MPNLHIMPLMGFHDLLSKLPFPTLTPALEQNQPPWKSLSLCSCCPQPPHIPQGLQLLPALTIFLKHIHIHEDWAQTCPPPEACAAWVPLPYVLTRSRMSPAQHTVCCVTMCYVTMSFPKERVFTSLCLSLLSYIRVSQPQHY